MKRIDDSSIKALISLLKDPSEVIHYEIHQNILFLGDEGITHLQTAFEESDSELQKERITKILDELKLTKLEQDLDCWKTHQSGNLLRGLLQIARYGHPNLDEVKIKEIISKIVLSLREKVKGKTPVEIVNALNQAILYDQGFSGKIRNYSGINNSFINKVMEDRISSPTGLSIMYLLVAKELNIPLVGINSPGHFILGYATEEFKEVDIENGSIINHILFYIDPFNSGQMILPDDYDQWLLQLPYQLEDKKYLPATNKAIVKIVMNNLICALFTTGYRSTAGELLNINEAL